MLSALALGCTVRPALKPGAALRSGAGSAACAQPSIRLQASRPLDSQWPEVRWLLE